MFELQDDLFTPALQYDLGKTVGFTARKIEHDGRKKYLANTVRHMSLSKLLCHMTDGRYPTGTVDMSALFPGYDFLAVSYRAKVCADCSSRYITLIVLIRYEPERI